MLKTKLSVLKSHIAAQDFRAAILLAAKFQDLGEQRGAILSAREAYLRPDFQRQIGRDPSILIAAGVAAIKDRYNV
jgi:hypothetical protein